MNGSPITTMVTAPIRTLVRFRFAAQGERALVFLAEHGDDRMEPPHGGDVWGYPRPRVREVWRGDFPSVLWVSLAEQRCWVELPLRTSSPSGAGQRYGVAWKVTNPVVAARSGVTLHGAQQSIVQHIGTQAALPGAADPLRQPPPRYGTTLVEPPGRTRVIEGAGIAYWFLDPPAGFLTGVATGAGPTLPPVFGEAHREAYRFYREVVAGGPADLAAFWLLQHPEQARDVLDWTVTHRELLTDRDGWERTLAATLQGLTKEDRGFVGANLARLLSDIGVPQGEEVLRRIEYDPAHGGANAGYGEPG
ncbi:hypothetical protein ACIA6D_09700 [Streptomyces cacaoi]